MTHNRSDEPRSAADRFADEIAFWGPLAILALLPFAIYLPLKTPGRGQEYFLEIASFSVFGFYLAVRFFGRDLRPRVDIPLVAALAGLAFAFVSAMFSPAPAYSATALLPWSAAIALFIMLRAASRQRDLFPIFSWVLAIQAAPLALYAIAQFFGFELEWLPYGEDVQKNRVISTFGHPNFFGSYIAPMIFICLARGAAPGLLPARLVAIAIAFVAMLALALARARAAWIGTALGLMTAGVSIAIARRDQWQPLLARRRAIAIGAAALVCILAAGVVLGPARQPIARRLGSLTEGSQWETRLYFWYIAAGAHSPLSPVGIGRGGFGRVFWDEADKLQLSDVGNYFRRNHVALTGYSRALDPGNVHNDYLEMWAESGPGALFAHLLLVGYLIFFFAARLWRIGIRSLEPARMPVMKSLALGGFVAALFDALLGFPLALPCSLALFWFYCALLGQYIEDPER